MIDLSTAMNKNNRQLESLTLTPVPAVCRNDSARVASTSDFHCCSHIDRIHFAFVVFSRLAGTVLGIILINDAKLRDFV